MRSFVFAIPAVLLAIAIPRSSVEPPPSTPPTFYRDILPILQQHCQRCHRPGEIAPMPLVTYDQVKSWTRLMNQDVHSRRMPPWFADPCCGHFANEPPPPHWAERWNIAEPDQVLPMPKPVAIPASGDVEYTYEIVPTNFTQDKWVQMSEIRPSNRQYVHHAVVYIRPPDSQWLRGAPLNTPFTASSLNDPALRHQAHETTSDLLLVYAPGSSPDQWPDDMAKLIPAHSDLVFQMHYTTNGLAGEDQTSVGLVFSKHAPKERVLTLQLANDHDPIPIPPNTDNYRVEVHGTLPHDATLLSFFPHMHLRGKRFEYNLVHPDHTTETLLRVHYEFYWQLRYRLAQPLPVKAGAWLRAVAWYDNSSNNAHNPDPDSPVTWGDQTYNEIMVGFFDVAVPAGMDKQHFFLHDKH